MIDDFIRQFVQIVHSEEGGSLLRPPATGAEISAFEERHAVRLPHDLRSFYTTVNGSEPWVTDAWLEFWPVGGIKLSSEFLERSDRDRFDFCIGDYCLCAAVLEVRLNPSGNGPTRVHWGDDRMPSFESFTDFLRALVSDPVSVL